MSHKIDIRVYYEDTDSGGIVYYANYMKFAERARTEYLRDLGYDHITLEREKGLFFVVRHVEADYYKPAKLDDLLAVDTQVSDVKNASFAMKQTIRRDNTVLVSMAVKLACINKDNRPVKIPQDMKALLEKDIKEG